MKSKKHIKNYSKDEEAQPMMVSDYEEVYEVPSRVSGKETAMKNFEYEEFRKIVERGPFTLGDWAALLYMSERTLHRYAKDGADFNGLQIERIRLLEKLIDTGNEFFGGENFRAWLAYRPFSFNGEKVREKLNTHDGIQQTIDLIQRLQHGIPA